MLPTRKLLALWVLSVALSVGVGFGIYENGKAGDCKPHEVDGQCGMSTFVGAIVGIGAGSVIFLVSSGYIAYCAFASRAA